MPEIRIRFKLASPGGLTMSQVQSLGVNLRRIVAEELNTPETPDGTLTEDDVEVNIALHEIIDIGVLPLQITVEANDFPERRVNLDKRRQRIVARVRKLRGSPKELIGNKKAFVWVKLSPASFEFI